MRSIALSCCPLIVALVTAAAHAADPAQGFKRHDIGAAVSIDLPERWKLQSFPMPIPGATNFRIDTGPMRIAITGIEAKAVTPLGETPKPLPTDEQSVKELLQRGSAPYVGRSAEQAVNPVVVAGTGFTLAHSTFSAPDSRPAFAAFAGRMYVCVTSAVMRTAASSFSITVGSDNCAGADHQAAIAALATVRIAD